MREQGSHTFQHIPLSDECEQVSGADVDSRVFVYFKVNVRVNTRVLSFRVEPVQHAALRFPRNRRTTLGLGLPHRMFSHRWAPSTLAASTSQLMRRLIVGLCSAHLEQVTVFP
ncbi:hypothetical protein AAFF_G00008820 [Aldrovandia affinis]|uniref:Uncharacterized protein n=1 Tax=Aldrovandia affinis TaxID=143900 RepID=A0AAD7X0R8_9TELE|nr:hypothetical protein AAFF_G00008820 [Aldrovandia affinis]